MSFDVGDVATLNYTLTVDGTPTAATVTVTVTAPDGTVSSPTVTTATAGSYSTSVLVAQAGTWAYRWVASGAATDVEVGTFTVRAQQGARDYITAAQLKAHLSIDDTADDAALARVVSATSRAIERHCRRRFWRDTSTRTYHADSCGRVQVDDIATAAGLVVTTDGDDDGDFEQTWTLATDFAVEPANALADERPITRLVAVGDLRFPAGARRAAVSVTATFGWPEVPDEVVEAALIKAARLFRRKDTPEGVAGTGEFGVVRISNREDPDVAALLAPYRRLVNIA